MQDHNLQTSPNNKTARDNKPTSELEPIPDKVYFTIGEVGKLCELKPHVLRYWEQEFPQLKPSKRRGNRRYYQRKDVILIRQIRNLLYDRGFTIDGARGQLSGDKSKQDKSHKIGEFMQTIINDLEGVLYELEEA